MLGREDCAASFLVTLLNVPSLTPCFCTKTVVVLFPDTLHRFFLNVICRERKRACRTFTAFIFLFRPETSNVSKTRAATHAVGSGNRLTLSIEDIHIPHKGYSDEQGIKGRICVTSRASARPSAAPGDHRGAVQWE